MRYDLYKFLLLLVFWSSQGSAQDRWLNGNSAYLKWVATALCHENSPVICLTVQLNNLEFVHKDQIGLVEPIKFDIGTLVPVYRRMYQLQQEARAAAGQDEYLAHLYWERGLIVEGRDRCDTGSVACYAISGLIAAVGGPKGIAAGAVIAGACYLVHSSCKSNWENQLFIIDRAIAEYDKCALGDKECYKRAFEMKNLKPQPLPSPVDVRQSNGSGKIGGYGGSAGFGSSSSGSGGGTNPGSLSEQIHYRCVTAQTGYRNGKQWLTQICGYG